MEQEDRHPYSILRHSLNTVESGDPRPLTLREWRSHLIGCSFKPLFPGIQNHGELGLATLPIPDIAQAISHHFLLTS